MQAEIPWRQAMPASFMFIMCLYFLLVYCTRELASSDGIMKGEFKLKIRELIIYLVQRYIRHDLYFGHFNLFIAVVSKRYHILSKFND